jgi:RNA polymerase sigma-70 factor, ECF subfamily
MVEPTDRTSDADLVSAIAAADERGLAEVYRRHAGIVFGMAKRILGDGSMAEDVLQDVFVRLWEQPGRYDPSRGALRSFLVRDAHGRAVDRLRSETARNRREDRHERLSVDADDDIDREVWAMIRSEKVREAIGQLVPGEREAILLAYFGGFTYREVAKLTDVPEGTVKTRIRTGLAKLATKLEAAGIGAAR